MTMIVYNVIYGMSLLKALISYVTYSGVLSTRTCTNKEDEEEEEEEE